jgi:hypothetical protein
MEGAIGGWPLFPISVAKFDLSNAFTFLRDPQSRLHSLYRDLARYPSQATNRRA